MEETILGCVVIICLIDGFVIIDNFFHPIWLEVQSRIPIWVPFQINVSIESLKLRERSSTGGVRHAYCVVGLNVFSWWRITCHERRRKLLIG